MNYDLKLGLVKERAGKAKRVLIQLPSGLRKYTLDIARTIIEAGAEPIIWAGSCYGACDLPDYKCDLLIHFGHEEFITESTS